MIFLMYGCCKPLVTDISVFTDILILVSYTLHTIKIQKIQKFPENVVMQICDATWTEEIYMNPHQKESRQTKNPIANYRTEEILPRACTSGPPARACRERKSLSHINE